MASLYEMLEMNAQAHPDHGIACDGHFDTYRDLLLWADTLAAHVRGMNIPAGAVAAIYLPNGIDLVLAHLTCLRLNLVILPLNINYTQQELEYLLSDSQAALLIADCQTHSWLQTHVFESAALKEVLDTANIGPILSRPPEHELEEFTPPEENQTALICYTSGTTGKPKGAMLTHRNIVFDVNTLLSEWQVSPYDRLLLCLPMFHVHGLILGLYGCFLFGHTCLLQAQFNAETVLNSLLNERVTLFMGVPTMYARLVKLDAIAALQDSTMRLFTSGSAPLSTELFETFARLTGFRIVERYGLSETIINTTNPLNGPQRPGTVGKPLQGVEVRILDQQGRPVTAGQAGEIWVKGPNVFKGYLNRSEINQSLFRDGWFPTQDLGYWNEEGYLVINGRASELIISGGYNVYPKEVEAVLESHAQVAEAAVLGRPDAELGEQVAAFLVLKETEGFEEAAMIEFCKQHLAPYKIPRHWQLLPSLPRNAMGKLQKHLLKDSIT